MPETANRLPDTLQEIVDEFKLAEGKEKLELLLEYSDALPDLPERFLPLRDQMAEVHECQAPVLIHAEYADGKMIYHFDIPQSAPTVRGYAAIMHEGTTGSTPEEILSIPADFFVEMGLQSMLSAQRLNGLSAVLAHMKRLALQKVEAPA